MNGQGLHVPGGPPPARLQQVKELITVAEANDFLRKADWVLLAMHPNVAPGVDQSKMVYVFGKVGR